MTRNPQDPEGQYEHPQYCAEEGYVYCSTHMDLSTDKKNITDLVISDLRGRSAIGRAKYGRDLMPHDGRDSLQDLYEELLDACQYIKKYMLEVKDE